jgi:aspartyl-tRNA(Asn)/glutamyl-tRNA(Gln) amidotransferase subunit C
MSFTRADVERVAALARLALTDEEKDLFAHQLAHILQYADEVQSVDTSGVAPTAQALAYAPHLRDDEPVPSLPRDRVIGGAPEGAAGLFKVPRVLG